MIEPYPIHTTGDPEGAYVVVDRSLDSARVQASIEELHTATYCPVCEPAGYSGNLVGSWARRIWSCPNCGVYGYWRTA